MTGDTLEYPAYPFTQDGSEDPPGPRNAGDSSAWRRLPSRGRSNSEPQHPGRPHRTPAIRVGIDDRIYHPGRRLCERDAGTARRQTQEPGRSPQEQPLENRVGRRLPGRLHVGAGIGGLFGSKNKDIWELDPFGLVKVLADRRDGLSLMLLDWDNEKVFLPRKKPELIYFRSTGEWKYIQEDANVTLPDDLPVFRLTPPKDAEFAPTRKGPFAEPPIPVAPIPPSQ